MGGIAAAAGGGKGGGGTSGGGYSNLTDAIQRAGGISAEFTQKAIDSLNQYYASAQQQYGNYYNVSRSDIQNANTQSQNLLQGGFNQGTQALLSGQQQAGTYLAPYINAGLPALDAYSQSMGLGTPVGGSLQAFNQQQAAATAQQNANMAIGNKYNQDLSTYNQAQNQFQNKLDAFNAGNVSTPGANASAATPGANAGFVYDPTTGMANRAATGVQGMDQIDAALAAGRAKLNSLAPNGNPNYGTQVYQTILNQPGSTDQDKIGALQQMIGDLNNLDRGRGAGEIGQMQAAISGYKGPTEAASQNIGMAPTAPNQAQYLPAQTPIAPAPEMTSNAAAAQQGLQNFYASPQAQVLYGGNPMDMSTQSIQERFQNDPGYQFQLQQGLKAVQNSQLAKGAGYGPQGAQAMQEFGQGLASTNFDQYRNSLANTFSQYQNQLQQLSGMGATASGAGASLAQQTGQGINANATNLATGQANLNAAAAQQTGANAMAAGQNTATMAQNQGNALSNVYTNQGNEQANMQLALGQAQAAQSQYQNSAQANAMGSLGSAIGGAGSLMSLFGSSQGGGGGLMSAGKGAASGAAAGSMFGPYGAAIGGIGGGVLGLFS